MIDLALNDRMFLHDELDCALQELDILFNTENTQLLGYPEYGFNIEPYLYTLSPAVDAMQQYINEIIEKHTLYVKKFKYDINVNYYNGDYRSIYVVQIVIYDNTGLPRTRNYKFE